MNIFYWLMTVLGLGMVFLAGVVLILWGAWELLEWIGGDRWKRNE